MSAVERGTTPAADVDVRPDVTQALRRRDGASTTSSFAIDARRDVRAHRPRRRRARRRRSGWRAGCCAPTAARCACSAAIRCASTAPITGARRLPVAALQPLRRSDHRREHRLLRRDSRRRATTRRARDRLLEMTQLTPFRDAPRRPAVGRHEAEAGAGLHARPRAARSCCSTSRRPASIRCRGASSGSCCRSSSSTGLTIVMATPYLDEAERCARVALLHEGRLLALDAPGAPAGGARRRSWSRSIVDAPRPPIERARARCPASPTCRRSASARTCGSPPAPRPTACATIQRGARPRTASG